MIKPWPTVRSESLANYRIFRARRDHKISPRTGAEHDFFVLDCPDWVNVVAVTPDQQLVMVEQFRHGTNTVDLEIPGGVMDAQDASPVHTGLRELREETGYVGDNARLLAQVRPNPAFMSNTCYTVLIEHCQWRQPVELDLAEDVATCLVPIAELPALITRGRVAHSLVVTALCHFLYLHPELARPSLRADEGLGQS